MSYVQQQYQACSTSPVFNNLMPAGGVAVRLPGLRQPMPQQFTPYPAASHSDPWAKPQQTTPSFNVPAKLGRRHGGRPNKAHLAAPTWRAPEPQQEQPQTAASTVNAAPALAAQATTTTTSTTASTTTRVTFASNKHQPPSTRPAVVDPDADEKDWLAAQKARAGSARAAAQAAFVCKHETAVSSSVPIRVRLECLLSEARNYEVKRLAMHDARTEASSAVRAQHVAMVNAGYRNLILDARHRCSVIEASGATLEQQHKIGGEAVAAFASMLAWSDGIVSIETVSGSPQVSAQSAPRGLPPQIRGLGTAPGSPVVRVGGPSTAAMATKAFTPAPSSPTYKFTVPQRLAVDQRKVAANAAARHRRLPSAVAARCGAAATTSIAVGVPPLAPFAAA